MVSVFLVQGQGKLGQKEERKGFRRLGVEKKKWDFEDFFFCLRPPAIVTLGTSMETFALVTALGENGAKDAQESSPGIKRSSVHEAVVTNSHPLEL